MTEREPITGQELKKAQDKAGELLAAFLNEYVNAERHKEAMEALRPFLVAYSNTEILSFIDMMKEAVLTAMPHDE